MEVLIWQELSIVPGYNQCFIAQIIKTFDESFHLVSEPAWNDSKTALELEHNPVNPFVFCANISSPYTLAQLSLESELKPRVKSPDLVGRFGPI